MAIRWEPKQMRQPPTARDPSTLEDHPQLQFQSQTSKYLDNQINQKDDLEQSHLSKENQVFFPIKTITPLNLLTPKAQDEKPSYIANEKQIKTNRGKEATQSQSVLPSILIQFQETTFEPQTRSVSRPSSKMLRHDCSLTSLRKSAAKEKLTLNKREDLNSAQFDYVTSELRKQKQLLEHQLQAVQEQSSWKQSFWKSRIEMMKQKHKLQLKQVRDFQKQQTSEQFQHFHEQIRQKQQVITDLQQVILQNQQREQTEQQMHEEITRLKCAYQNLQQKINDQEIQVEQIKSCEFAQNQKEIQIESLVYDLQAQKAVNKDLETKLNYLQQNQTVACETVERLQYLTYQPRRSRIARSIIQKQCFKPSIQIQLNYQDMEEANCQLQAKCELLKSQKEVLSIEVQKLKDQNQQYIQQISDNSREHENLLKQIELLQKSSNKSVAGDVVDFQERLSGHSLPTDEDAYMDAKSQNSVLRQNWSSC